MKELLRERWEDWTTSDESLCNNLLLFSIN